MKERSSPREKQHSKVLAFLQTRYGIEHKDILILIKEKERQKKEQESHYVPVSLFAKTPLSSLELITRFLRDIKKLKFTEMEKILGRDQRVLSTTYRNAKKKFPSEIQITATKYYVPCHLLQNKQFSVLENIVLYLNQAYHLSNAEIAILLNKDPRTIWTVLDRIKKKGKEVNT